MALFPRFGLVPTSPIHGWTLVLLKVAYSSPAVQYMLTTWSFSRNPRQICRQLWTQSVIGVSSGASPSALDQRGQRSSFSVLPVMLSLAKCTSKATFCLSSLPIATLEWSSLPHFPGAIMSIIWWTAGADCLRSVCLGFDQSPCQSISRSFLSTYVLPSASFGIEFAGECPRSLARFDRALRQWGPHLLGWPSGTPNASVLCELGLHDGLRVSSGRALALHARLASFALGSRPPVPASVFTLAQSPPPGSWAHWCRAVISHHSVQRPDLCGVGPGCSASVTQRWVRRSVTPVLDRSWQQRVERSLGLLHTIRCDQRAQPQLSLPAFVYSQSVDAGLARWWGLARYGHYPGPGGRAARHRNSSLVCCFCCADVGDLAHCLSYCPAFSDLRAQWCVDTGVAPSDGPWWASVAWVFDPWHVDNTPSVMRARVRFVGLVCSRLERSLPSC